MTILQKLFLLALLTTLLSACGVGGVSPAKLDCDNPTVENTAECEKQDAESSVWDKMKWNEGKWG